MDKLVGMVYNGYNKTKEADIMVIKMGGEYRFNYRVDDKTENADDIELLINNDSFKCIVIDDCGTNDFGHLYEVESETGSQFFAYDKELDEV